LSDHLSQLVALILSAAVIMGSPGPSTMSVTAVGAAYGLGRSLNYASGLILGTSAVLLAVATGIFALLLSVPGLEPVFQTASALYMLYLAWKIATAPPLSNQDPALSAPSLATGFLLAIANPKAYVAIAAVFAASALGPVAKTVALVVMIVVIHACWLFAGTSLSRLLRDPMRSRVVNVVFALTLVAMTILSLLR
jgi:threonine/homoserine/homoserine lactone efflux protein